MFINSHNGKKIWRREGNQVIPGYLIYKLKARNTVCIQHAKQINA